MGQTFAFACAGRWNTVQMILAQCYTNIFTYIYIILPILNVCRETVKVAQQEAVASHLAYCHTLRLKIINCQKLCCESVSAVD